MKLKQILAPAGACLLMAGLASALPASAADWAVWKGQDEAAPRAIYTTGAETAGAVLTCDGKGLMSAMLALAPASMPDLLERNAPYARGTDANVTIGDHAYIGSGAIIRQGLTIGADAIVGMGAVVTRDVPAGAMAVGRAKMEIKEGFWARMYAKLKAKKSRSVN